MAEEENGFLHIFSMERLKYVKRILFINKSIIQNVIFSVLMGACFVIRLKPRVSEDFNAETDMKVTNFGQWLLYGMLLICVFDLVYTLNA